MHGLGAVRLAFGDLPALQRLCAKCSDFFELILGSVSVETIAAEILGPAEAEYAHGRKQVWGIQADGELIAIAELLENHPDVREWYIGLLVIDPQHRRQGLGAEFTTAILDWIASLGGRTVRLIVQGQNPEAREFWQRQGFATERDVLKRLGKRDSVASILVRRTGAS